MEKVKPLMWYDDSTGKFMNITLTERQRITAEVEAILLSALEKGLVSVNTTRAVLAAIRGDV